MQLFLMFLGGVMVGAVGSYFATMKLCRDALEDILRKWPNREVFGDE